MFLLLLVSVLMLYVVLIKANQLYLSRKWGCKDPKQLNSGLFGIKFLKSQLEAKNDGLLLPKQASMFDDSHSHTLATKLLGSNIFFTCSGENMKAVLGTQVNEFGIGYRKNALYPLIGHGIFASDGDRWKISREMLRPQFAREQVAHIQTLEPHIQHLISIIKQHKGEKLDLQDYFHKLTIDAASEFLFGESTNTLISNSVNESEFAQAFNEVQDVITKRLMAGPLSFLFSDKQFKKNLEIIHSLVQHYVDIALNTSPEELDKHSKGGYVLLYEIVRKTRDRKVLQDELLSILLAGRNTTAGLLSFLFYELARNPDIFNKLRSEIDLHFGSGESTDLDKISFESMKRCSYLKYCINETLRLHPPVTRNMRAALVNTTLPKGGGEFGEDAVFVPKGTKVAFNIYKCHRQKLVFGEDCDTFKPERWETLKPGWSFMPFGSGPRICLGQQFALTEASYVTVRFLQTFSNIEGNIETDYPPKKVANSTLRLLNGCEVSLY